MPEKKLTLEEKIEFETKVARKITETIKTINPPMNIAIMAIMRTLIACCNSMEFTDDQFDGFLKELSKGFKEIRIIRALERNEKP